MRISAKAQLFCVKLRKNGNEIPKFRIRYGGAIVHEFDADHVGEAGQIARYFLNQRYGHLKVMIEWVPDELTKERPEAKDEVQP